MSEKLLESILKEIKGLREDHKGSKLETCTAQEALQIIGFKNRGYLTYFHRQGLLTRRKGGSSYLYFKKECESLAEMIKNGAMHVPPVKYLYE